MLITIRSLVYFCSMVLSVVLFGLAMVTIGLLLPLSARDSIAQAWASTNMWLMRVICGLKYRLEGAENLPHDAAIIMAKHQSSWETISLKHILIKQQTWILKQELMRIPIFGWALATIPTIAIDRSAGRKAIQQIIQQGTEYMDQGRLVVVFPEGTRTAPGTTRKYGLGGGLLAEKSGYPVVPIAHNAGIFWQRRALNKYPGTIDVVVGAPIMTQGKTAAEIMQEVETWIEGKVAELPQGERERG